MTIVEQFYSVLNEATINERIRIFEHFSKLYPYEYKLATMGPNERKFYDSQARRENAQ